MVLGRDNWRFSAMTGGLTQKALLEDLGVTSLGQKESTVRKAAGIDRYRHDVELLHSRRRGYYLEMLARDDEARVPVGPPVPREAPSTEPRS